MAQTPKLQGAGAQHDFRLAVADSSVVMLGIAVLGLGLGVILNAHGLPVWTAPLLSALVFAGSVEFLMVGMVSAGTPLASIALTVFLVNARHLVYGLSYPLHSVKGFWAKALAIHTLCDEAFAVNSGPDRNERSGARILWVNTLIYVSWILSVVLGYILGASFLNDLKGVDFVMVAIFTVLAMDGYRANPDRVTALFVAISAAIALIFAPSSFLVVALGSYVVLLLARFPVAKRRGTLPAHSEQKTSEVTGFASEDNGGSAAAARKTVNIKSASRLFDPPFSFLFHAEPAAIRPSRRHLVSRRPQI